MQSCSAGVYFFRTLHRFFLCDYERHDQSTNYTMIFREEKGLHDVHNEHKVCTVCISVYTQTFCSQPGFVCSLNPKCLQLETCSVIF